MEDLTAQWAKLAMPSWRGLAGEVYEQKAPAVIVVDKLGRGNSYEVYVDGRQVSREWLLDLAKIRAEKELGPCRWERSRTDSQNALHYYFGYTTEFTDPQIVYFGWPE